MADFNDATAVQWTPDVPPTQTRQPVPTSKGSQASTGACDACRARKVRCLANESSMSSKCQRCARAGRECVYTVHSKTRRRKRTDTRVKELEEKVKNLSMLLEQGKGPTKSVPRRGSGQSPPAQDDDMNDEDEEWSDEGEEEEHQEDDSLMGTTGKNFDGHIAFRSSGLGPPLTGESPKNRTHIPTQISGDTKFVPTGSVSPDVIERGLITVEKAQEIFDRYLKILSPNYPALHFPPDTTAAVMRKQRPILFLATLAAAAGNQDPTLNLALNQEILQVYANKVAVHGEKSLELVMSILISTLWYYPPDKFEELKFHQYIHMAATMALDIGLGKRPRVNQGGEEPSYTPSHVERKNSNMGPRSLTFSSKSYPDSATLESRRTLLACYLSCSGVSMSLRLPNMLRFTGWMNDCLNVLETSPEAAPGDKRFAAWIRVQRLAEECVIAFSLDDPGNTASLCDSRVQQMLKSYESRLEELMKAMNATPGILDGFLEINFHINNIYMHEIALHPEHDSEDFRPPFFVAATSPKTQISLGPAYVQAITVCMRSAQSAIKVFLGMHIDTIRALPALLYVRIVYSCIILIKLDISTNSPDSEIGKIIDRNGLLTRAYIEKALIQIKRVAGNDSKNILAAKFCMILGKLVIWYRQINQPEAKQAQHTTFSSAKSFSNSFKPDELPPDLTYPLGVENYLAWSGPMPPATAVPPIPRFDGNFTSFDSSLAAPQYPTPTQSPLSAQNLPATIPTQELPNISAMYSEGTAAQSMYYYSPPKLMDQPSQQDAIPMPDVNPSMFNQLQGADPFTYAQDPNEWIFDGMDYSGIANVPEIDWDSIPAPQ